MSCNSDENDQINYLVVINLEQQYSIWADHRELPAGWQAVGPSGKKQSCLDYIDRVWTDMRPASVRRQLARTGAAPDAEFGRN